MCAKLLKDHTNFHCIQNNHNKHLKSTGIKLNRIKMVLDYFLLEIGSPKYAVQRFVCLATNRSFLLPLFSIDRYVVVICS